MLTDAEIGRASLGLWALYGAAAMFGVITVGTFAWNVAQRLHDDGVSIGAGLRSALRF